MDEQLRFDIGPVPVYFVPDVWQQYGRLLAAHDQEEGPAALRELQRVLKEKLRGKNVRFKRVETQIQWAWGDWLLQGEAGGMKQKQLKEEALGISGYEWGTLKNFKSISSRFPTSRRRDDLTWSHHSLIASLDDKTQDRLLDRAIEEKLSHGKLKAEVKRRGRPGDWWWDTPVLKVRPNSRSLYEFLVALAKARKVRSPDVMLWNLAAEHVRENKDKLIAEAATPEFKERIEVLVQHSNSGGPKDKGAESILKTLKILEEQPASYAKQLLTVA